jgi:hypothetical protein
VTRHGTHVILDHICMHLSMRSLPQQVAAIRAHTALHLAAASSLHLRRLHLVCVHNTVAPWCAHHKRMCHCCSCFALKDLYISHSIPCRVCCTCYSIPSPLSGCCVESPRQLASGNGSLTSQRAMPRTMTHAKHVYLAQQQQEYQVHSTTTREKLVLADGR